MTTIPYTSFETSYNAWPKNGAVSYEYQPIKTNISVDSSDLLVRFSNLPVGVTVANPPAQIPYQMYRPLYVTIKDDNYDISYRIEFNSDPLSDGWISLFEGEIIWRDNDSISDYVDSTGINLSIFNVGSETFLSGNFSATLYEDPLDYYILAKITNLTEGEIGYVSDGKATFEVMNQSSPFLSITNHGSDAIINTYTKVDNNTIRIPRSMDGAGVGPVANYPLNKLHVLFNR